MESFFIRFKNALVLLAILLVQTLALAVQVRRPADPMHPDATQVRLIRMWSLGAMTPFERTATFLGHGVRGAWSDYIDVRQMRRQNVELTQQLAQTKMQLGAIAADALAGQRLEHLLAFQQQYVVKTLPAQVIGTSGSEQSRLLILDKGSEDGLRPDMAVITPDGVVGKIRDVFAHTSQLLLINDQTAGAGVVLQATRIRAVLHGSAMGQVQITNLTADSRIKPGDVVVTSGGDQVFPRGLAVGTIESIRPDPDHQPYTIIALKPSANLFQLEEVLIITGLDPTLPPAMQVQLLADQAMHAADESADRLPSLHDDGAPAGTPDPMIKDGDNAPPPPDNSTGLVPKPKASLRPDRYTQGSTPPASDLTPGAARPGQTTNTEAPHR